MRLAGWIALLAALAASAPALAQGGASVHAVDTDPAGESSYHYDPRELTVAPGATVTFVGGSVEPHTLTHDAPQGSRLFDTGTVDKGATATFTAPHATGDYPFHCLYHGSMTGVLHVSTASATATTALATSTPAKGTPLLGAAGLVAVLALASLMLRRR
jgi:plastocyanin